MPRDTKQTAERAARRRFNQELAARGGGGEVTDEELIDVIGLADDEDRPASLAKLEAVDFADAVGTVFARRRTYGHVALPTRAVHEKPRTETPQRNSPLASEGWRAFLAGRQERVLTRFVSERDDARAQLGLQPLIPMSQTRSAQRAWLGGDRDEETRDLFVPELGDSFEDDEIEEYVAQLGDDTAYGFGYANAARLWAQGEELAALGGQEQALEWLLAYIARQPSSGVSETLWWCDAPEEVVALPFPAKCYPLRTLRDLARSIASAAGCHEGEATTWLLADMPPQVPGTMSIVSYPATIEWAREPDGTPFVVPHAERRYVITVASGLVSPDDVRALYRRVRNADYGLSTDPAARQSVWSAELARFVAGERHSSLMGGGGIPTWEEMWRRVATQHLPTWEEMWRGWNARYPQKPFTSWRAMRSSYLNATTHAAASGEADNPKESNR